MKDKLIVVRKWKEPEVRAFMSRAEVGADMDVDLYLESLVFQVNNLPLILTKAALLDKLKEASALVLNEMKQTTKYVV